MMVFRNTGSADPFQSLTLRYQAQLDNVDKALKGVRGNLFQQDSPGSCKLNRMKVCVLFHENPFARAPGIDLVRLRAIAGGLIRRGIEARVVAPVEEPGVWQEGIRVLPLEVLDRAGRFDLVKTCYHQSIRYLGAHQGPVVSRIVRVVDQHLPKRDDKTRRELTACQEIIADRARTVALNNGLNAERWRALYGQGQQIVLTPTGCPADLPPAGENPYPGGEKAVLFLGSLASAHMAEMLNAAAEGLQGRARVHLLGANKTGLYGEEVPLHPEIILHRPRPEEEIWGFIRFARLGLALATADLAFDNDVSKVYNYLRGGLPVLCEEPILQGGLVRKTGLGAVFPFGDKAAMITLAQKLVDQSWEGKREAAMEFMAGVHSWDNRVETYVKLFRELAG